jgi:hypothetical protein
MNTARASFPQVGTPICHRCRNGNPAPTKDPSNHLCVPNPDLYIGYGVNVGDLVEKSDTLVGGFVHPSNYIISGYTMLPCPFECIIGSNNNRVWKIAHGASANGLCYIYVTTAGAVTMVFYKLDGTRELSRNLPSVSRILIYFNRFRNGLAITPPTGNPGIHSGDGGLEA